MSESNDDNVFDEIEAVLVNEDDEESTGGLPADVSSSVSNFAESYPVDGIMSVPIEIVVAVGKATPLIKDFLAMTRDSLLILDSKIDDPVEVRVAGRTIARGELQEVPDQEGVLCVRLTEIVTRGDS